MREGRVVRRLFFFSKCSSGRENDVPQLSKQPAEKRSIMKTKFQIQFDLPSILFCIRRFFMYPLTGEYQLLEAKTLTFSNAKGLKFLVESTRSPSMEME